MDLIPAIDIRGGNCVRLYKGDYDQSLKLLETAKVLNSASITKSGIMVGLGEEIDEIKQTMKDLVSVGCDLLTIGQ